MGNNLSRRAEDYLRGVYAIVERKGYARIKDIAEELDVQPSTTSEMMRKLDKEGLLVYEKYGGRQDFLMLGISLDRSEAQVRDFAKEQKLGWPQAFEGRGWDSGPARTFGVQAIPATFLIDKEGKIAGVNLRGEDLAGAIEGLLK